MYIRNEQTLYIYFTWNDLISSRCIFLKYQSFITEYKVLKEWCSIWFSRHKFQENGLSQSTFVVHSWIFWTYRFIPRAFPKGLLYQGFFMNLNSLFVLSVNLSIKFLEQKRENNVLTSSTVAVSCINWKIWMIFDN